jgi:hypothetical protein
VLVVVSSLLQLAFGCIALYQIEKVRREKAAELHQYPDDPELLAADLRYAEVARRYALATRLTTMPTVAKWWLYSGVGVLASSSYALLFMADELFEPFALTDPIHSVLCLQCETALVKPPLGWLALGLLAYGCVALWLYERWAKRRMVQLPAQPMQPAQDEHGSRTADQGAGACAGAAAATVEADSAAGAATSEVRVEAVALHVEMTAVEMSPHVARDDLDARSSAQRPVGAKKPFVEQGVSDTPL